MKDVYDCVMKLDEYVVTECTFEEESCLLISHKQLYNHPPFGMTARCRISVKVQEYTVHVLMRAVESGLLSAATATETILHLCSKYSTTSESYKFCPGLQPAEYERHKDIIRFDVKSVRRTTEPFDRVDSINCLMWFEIGKKARKERREANEVVCSRCVRLRCDLERQIKRTENESPSKKIKRQNPSSRARLSYMSPTSQLKRAQSQRIERGKDKRKLQRYEHTELPLDSEQDDEISTVVSTIDQSFSDELEKLYEEGDEHGVGDKLRDVWSVDSKRERSEFKTDQSRNSK